MMNGHHKTEDGQVLVLLVLGIIGLLAFAALAIDGGMVLVERRAAQNGADAASLTGGGQIITKFASNNVTYQDWDCNDAWVVSANNDAVYSAIARAETNNYTIDGDLSDNNGVAIYCEDGFDNGTFVDKYMDVETHITSDIQTAFAHFVSGQSIQTINQAVARVRPQVPFAFGHAVVGLNDSGCQGNQNGVVLDGNADVQIDGGGIFSNGCMRASGSSLEIDVDDGSNTYMLEYDTSGNPSVDPAPSQGTEWLPDFSTLIPAPQCPVVNQGNVSGDATISPGLYNRIRVNGGKTVTLLPGLYCIQDRITVNGGGTLIGSDVTIYLVGGNFETSGGATVQLDAPPDYGYVPESIPGVLIYMAPGNTGEINLMGDSNSWYEGAVYAPDGEIEVGGTGSLLETYHTQLIGWNVFIHGNINIDINFNDAQTYQVPPSIELRR